MVQGFMFRVPVRETRSPKLCGIVWHTVMLLQCHVSACVASGTRVWQRLILNPFVVLRCADLQKPLLPSSQGKPKNIGESLYKSIVYGLINGIVGIPTMISFAAIIYRVIRPSPAV
jgi:hypothetical protein